MRIFSRQIGVTQSITPEGFLLCEGVPIARAGAYIYTAADLPTVRAGKDGLITVTRDESEVFKPETIASFEGKPVTINHTFVDPSNFKRVSVGHVQNVRRSESERDLLLGDLLITDAAAIDLVKYDPAKRKQSEFREVSCGYDAEYMQVEPGQAYQTNIIGNHVAIVRRGRAGARCSIQDEDTMSKQATPTTLLSRLLRAVRTGDSAAIQQVTEDAESELEAQETADAEAARKQTTDAIAALTETVTSLKKTVDELTKPKTEDDATALNDEDEAKNAQATADAMSATVSQAEILVPGFVMPTADSVTDAESVAAIQRKILTEATRNAETNAVIAPLFVGRTVDSLTADNVQTVFTAAAEMVKQANNARGARKSIPTGDAKNYAKTPAEINRVNAEFYSKP